MIALEEVSIRAGEFALRKVSFTVPTGSWCVFMGRTGSGKTTILELVCGLRRVDAGRIKVAGNDVTELAPKERGIGYVPQDRALFQTMTVRDNLAFSLKLRRWTRDQVEARVDELARLLGILHLLERFPQKLSGGESQRVALGRALAAKPSVLCLDEPLSALDDTTRDEMRAVLRSVHQHTPVTTLHVTHHADEGRGLADQLLVLQDGHVVPSAIPA